MYNFDRDSHEHIYPHTDMINAESDARWLFRRFADRYADAFNLADEKSIRTVLRAAKWWGIYRAARKIRRLEYGRNISIYGVSYISNECWSGCSFCPMGQDSIKIGDMMDELKSTCLSARRRTFLEAEIARLNAKKRTLTVEEAAEDFAALAKMGHTEICVLSGDGLCLDYRKLIPYVRAAMLTEGIHRVTLNISQFSEQGMYGFLYELQDGFELPEVELDFRLFQETYDRDAYAHFMSRCDQVHGKGNYDMRYQSQCAFLKASREVDQDDLRGVGDVGIGVLFGLTAYPIKEIKALADHAFKIWNQSGTRVFRCCLPFANEPDDSGVEIPYKVSGMKYAEEIMELTYALARLAMPNISIVSSERDGEGLLRKLDQYSNHTTLGVRPYPGGNIDALAQIEGRPMKYAGETAQADVHPRDIELTLKRWEKDGWNIINFNH